MIRFVLVLFLLPSTLLYSQTKPIIKDSLSTSKNLSINETIVYENLSIRFSEIIQDSRCPRNVNCVRAGEADIELVIIIDGKESSTVICRIDASGFVTEQNNLILETDKLKVYAFALTPYPVTTEPITKEVYILEVVYMTKTKQ